MQTEDHSIMAVEPARLCVVIGAMRCGTTTLFQLLRQVPSVSLTRMKEPDYFIAAKSLYRGPKWYASLFPSTDRLCVDISPNYAKMDVFPGVPEQIAAFNPLARIVYIVRDPVERAISEYHHQVAAGVALPPPEKLLDSPEGHHILSTSCYGRQLEAYRRVFSPSQILVVDMDELVADPQSVLANMLAFCGETSPLPRVAMSVENDRRSVEGLPRFWLALRRTQLGDRIRDLVPARLHKSLKRIGSKLLGRKPSGRQPAKFDEGTISRLKKLLSSDATEFRRLTGRGFDQWQV